MLEFKKVKKCKKRLMFDVIQPCSHTSHSGVQKIKCTRLGTFKASISTTTTFTRSSDSSSVRCTDPAIGQTVPAVLAERFQRGIVAIGIVGLEKSVAKLIPSQLYMETESVMNMYGPSSLVSSMPNEVN